MQGSFDGDMVLAEYNTLTVNVGVTLSSSYGLKVMKVDMTIWYNADKDLQEMNAKIEYLKVTVDYLKECLNNVTWRHQTIKNTIEWRKFMSGQ